MSEKLGQFECLETIGKGGMGEILLVHDPVCNREIALKRIRPDLENAAALKERFLKEAHITASLTHPGIISIYSIHEDDTPYYTMPYVEGGTLKEILKKGTESIPALLHIFKSLCQTIAYTHSKEILHRDIKPENVLVGKFGEVILLDWGLAQTFSDVKPESTETNHTDPGLTSPGKLVGTVAYMAPERTSDGLATVQSDIYALGVILYQILTLRFPFKRKSIKDFCKTKKYEKFIDPEEVAPYREVPPRLSQMVKKCLDPDPKNRYLDMESFIHDLTSHIEGRSEWFEDAKLDVTQKKHWEFQENVLISKHVAITQATEASNWVSMMISKHSFSENARLEADVFLENNSEGIGFLLSVPELSEREYPLDGYCLWIGSNLNPGSHLFRNTVDVMHEPDINLKIQAWHHIAIEKVDHNIRFFLDGELQFTYMSYLPLFGGHVGVLSRDNHYQISPISISSSSQNLQVSCLSVPDAFLASKNYKKALAEYRRIGDSFPGQTEGREALFRAGITLLEQAQTARSEKSIDKYYSLAIEEFSKLHATPGAPLEYLGKALVYQSLHDHAEEIKCLELGLRRYKSHPLIDAIEEQITYRMHEAAQRDRHSAYHLILIVLRLLPKISERTDSKHLFTHLINNWEKLPFLNSATNFAIPLAFWLGAPFILAEIYDGLTDEEEKEDLIFALHELGSHQIADKLYKMPFKEKDDFRTSSYLIQKALDEGQYARVHEMVKEVKTPISAEEQIHLDAYDIWAYLKENNHLAAEEIFEKHPLEMLNQETTVLHPLFGCYLYMTEGEEIAMIHFAGVIDTPYPRSWALLSHELTNKISESSWYNHAFLWEKRKLYQQLSLFYHCAHNSELEAYYDHLAKQEFIDTPE